MPGTDLAYHLANSTRKKKAFAVQRGPDVAPHSVRKRSGQMVQVGAFPRRNRRSPCWYRCGWGPQRLQ
eukprot:3765693-Rhodomonas_salina.2